MDKAKETELLRKRNASLSQELEEAKDKYDQLKYLNSESAKKAKELIIELEEIKAEWIESLDNLHAKQEECDKLIATLKQMEIIMREPMEQERATWYAKILSRLRK